MGFLEKIFGKKTEHVEIDKIELKEWLDSKKLLTEIDHEINKTLDGIKKLKSELNKKLEDLELAKLMNTDIPKREKQIMQGNRENYIRKTQLFLDELKVPDQDYIQISEFCSEFEERLYEFNENTSKTYFILTHFFDTEMKNIAGLLKRIENSIVNLVGLLKHEKVTQYKMLVSKINELNKSTIEHDKTSKKLDELEKEFEEAEKREVELNEKMDALKQSPDYNKCKKFDKRKTEIKDEVSSLNSKLNNKLKQFDKAMKKYMHTSLKKNTIANYREHPLQALEKDSKLEIINIIEKLKQEVKKGRIELKQKIKDKILKEDLTKVFLGKITSEHEKLKKERAKINQEEDKLTVMMNYKELQYKIEHNTDKIKQLKEKISDKKNLVSHLNIKNQVNKLQELLSSTTDCEVVIK